MKPSQVKQLLQVTCPGLQNLQVLYIYRSLTASQLLCGRAYGWENILVQCTQNSTSLCVSFSLLAMTVTGSAWSAKQLALTAKRLQQGVKVQSKPAVMLWHCRNHYDCLRWYCIDRHLLPSPAYK